MKIDKIDEVLMKIDKIDEGLFRIFIPFEGWVCTTVYVVVDGDRAVIIDSATHPSDVDEYILPALSELRIERDRVGLLLLTHSHSDHAGGAKRLMEALPKMCVRGGFSEDSGEGAELARSPRYSKLSDGEMIGDRLIALALRGHTKDSFGFFDIRTRTLLAGDCLQQRGIGKYRDGVGFPEEYLESVKKLSGMDIYRVVSSHEYDPLGDVAEGRDAVKKLLLLCLEAVFGKS